MKISKPDRKTQSPIFSKISKLYIPMVIIEKLTADYYDKNDPRGGRKQLHI